MSNLEKLNKILMSNLRIKDVSELKDDLGPDDLDEWDSLTHFDMITDMEEAFEISIAVEDSSRMYNIGKIREVLKEKYEVEL